jgi:Phosphoribosylaminoimidazole carboxylase C-terminal domain
MQTPGASLHWYGKAGISAGRKLGHVTITAGAGPGILLALPVMLPDCGSQGAGPRRQPPHSRRS